MSNIPITSLPVALALDGSEAVPIVQGGTTKRTTTGDIANTATGFVPTTRSITTPTAGGLTGGHSLATDVVLNWAPGNLNPKTAMVVADTFAINDSALTAPAQITFPNAMKALTGLPALSFPNALNDYFVINHAADGLTYKVNPSALNLTQGNMPAGGLSGQVLTKASNANYDTTWTTGGFLDQPVNVFLGGPSSGPNAQPGFRLLVGSDLPDPAPTTKGGVKSYASVTHQFINAIGTDGTPASAQPAFSDISGTATVSQGGTGATTFTAHGILLGETTSAIAATAAMTDGQLLIGQTGADPAPTTVSGDLTISNLGVTAIGNNKVTNAMLRTSSGLSVIGRSASTTGNVADITGTADQIFRVAPAGASLGFGSIDLSASAAVGSSILAAANGGTGIASYAVGDILYASGATTLAALADVATGNALISGGVTTAPSWGKVTPSHFSGTLPIANGGTGQTTDVAAFDALAPTNTRGDMIYRGATNNVRLGIGSANTVLRTNGTDPAWGSVVLSTDVTGTLPVANGGTGDVAFTLNGVLYGNNVSAVQVTAAGTTGDVLAGTTSAAPSFKSLSTVIDNIGSAQGQLLYRGASVWSALGAGTPGQVLATQGSGANPHWIDVAGTGTVTSVDGSGGTTGLTLTGGPITSVGTLTLGGTLIAANGGTGISSYTQGDILYASAGTTLSKLAKDTNATRYLSNTGSSNNPAWAQVNLANGVTGALPIANGGTGTTTGAREILGAARTYYVRTDGSDSNTGLTNSSGGAWLTWQHAIDVIAKTLDLNGYVVMVKAGQATATFADGIFVSGPFVGDTGGSSLSGTSSVVLEGSPSIAVTNATNATPIVVTAAGHNYANGDNVVISGVLGNLAANGSFKVASTNTGAGTFALTKMVDGSNVAGTGAYTSGGTVQAVDKILIAASTGLTQALWAFDGANIGISGFKLSSSAYIPVLATDFGQINLGKNSYAAPASALYNFYASRNGLIRINDSYSISGSPGSGGNFIQASHGGQVRQQIATGYAVANLTYDATLGFLYADSGEVVVTASPAGVPFSANGFTVTGSRWRAVNGSVIQVEGNWTPLDSLLLGNANGSDDLWDDITSTVLSGSAVSLTNATAANVTSISLTSGRWEISGVVGFSPAGGTTETAIAAWISTTSATLPTAPNNGAYFQSNQTVVGSPRIVPVGKTRITFTTTTTVYLSAEAFFSASTDAAYGYISASPIK